MFFCPKSEECRDTVKYQIEVLEISNDMDTVLLRSRSKLYSYQLHCFLLFCSEMVLSATGGGQKLCVLSLPCVPQSWEMLRLTQQELCLLEASAAFLLLKMYGAFQLKQGYN